METKNSVIKTALVPGLLVSLTAVLLSLTTSLLVTDFEQQKTYGWLTWLALIGLMVYFTLQYRKNNLQDLMTFKQGFKFLFVINLFYSFFFTVYNYVYMRYIDSSMVELVRDQAAEKISENPDLSQAQIDQAIEIQNKFISVPGMTVSTLLTTLLIGTLLALLLAAILKNAKADNSFDKDLS